MPKFESMADLMAEHEAELEAKGKAELAKERAAWEALPQVERDRILAERQAKWDALETTTEQADEDEEDEDEDEDENEED